MKFKTKNSNEMNYFYSLMIYYVQCYVFLLETFKNINK